MCHTRNARRRRPAPHRRPPRWQRDTITRAQQFGSQPQATGPSPRPTVLTLTSISKTYPTAAGPLRVLDDVTMTLESGEAAAITGPSGSGKSTLLYVIGGLEAPTGGSVDLDGTNPYALRAEPLARFRNREIGFVFQDH